jgi:AbrB family looped-hinge helix DNA binding protein
MKKVLMTNMSSKGQVVIPNEFRKILGLIAGTPLAVFTDGSTLLLKPVAVPEADAFEKLLRISRKAAKAAGLKKLDIAKTIKKVRNESRS